MTAVADRFAFHRLLLPHISPSYRSFSSSAPLLIKKKMPPKKAGAPEKKLLLGRPGNNLKIGIVGWALIVIRVQAMFLMSYFYCGIGVPNVGKSSFFNALSETGQSDVSVLPLPFPLLKIGFRVFVDLGKVANFPYATINPEVTLCCYGDLTICSYPRHFSKEARIPVPDVRFDWLCKTYKPASRVPAFLTCIDIAGLTAVSIILMFFLRWMAHNFLQGASTGAGLGNAFLSHVRAVDGILQMVRAFDDAEVTHVEGDVDPIRDMEIIQTELRLKDIEWVQKHLDGLKRTGRALNNTSLADKAKKEEIVRVPFFARRCHAFIFISRRPLRRS